MNASFHPLSHGLRHDSSPCTGEPYGQPLRPPLQRNQKHFVGVDVLIDPRAAISRPYGVGAGSLQRLCHLFGSHEDGVDVLLLMRRGEEHGLELAGRGVDPVL